MNGNQAVLSHPASSCSLIQVDLQPQRLLSIGYLRSGLIGCLRPSLAIDFGPTSTPDGTAKQKVVVGHLKTRLLECRLIFLHLAIELVLREILCHVDQLSGDPIPGADQILGRGKQEASCPGNRD